MDGGVFNRCAANPVRVAVKAPHEPETSRKDRWCLSAGGKHLLGKAVFDKLNISALDMQAWGLMV